MSDDARRWARRCPSPYRRCNWWRRLCVIGAEVVELPKRKA